MHQPCESLGYHPQGFLSALVPEKDLRGNLSSRPCLNLHIKRCLGPCIGAVSQEEYLQHGREIIMFLEGRSRDLIELVRSRMHEASERLDFERAAL